MRPSILLRWQKVCVKRHQHQFTVVLSNWTFRRHHWDEFCINSLVRRHTKSNWYRIWSQLTIQCVSASLSGLAIDLQKMPILVKKKIIFSDGAHFDLGGYVNKQNCCIRVTENPHAYIEKPTHLKRITFWCGFWSRGYNWVIFLRNWARSGRYNQRRSLLAHVERIFVHKNWRGRYWQHLVSTLDFLRSVFEDSIISRRADVVWLHRSCDLTPLENYLWDTVKDKCYTGKLETIDDLKNNICEAIDEKQLHTISIMCLKIWPIV